MTLTALALSALLMTARPGSVPQVTPSPTVPGGLACVTAGIALPGGVSWS